MADVGALSTWTRGTAVLGGAGIALAALGWFTVPFVTSDLMLLGAVFRDLPQREVIQSVLVPVAMLVVGALPPVLAAFIAVRLFRRPGHVNFVLAAVTLAIVSVDVLLLLALSVTAVALEVRH